MSETELSSSFDPYNLANYDPYIEYKKERKLVVKILLGYHLFVFLLAIIKTVLVVKRKKTLLKLNQITHILCSIGSLLLAMSYATALGKIDYIPYPLEKYGELTILLSFFMILLFWINSLYEGDPIYRIIKHPKFFIAIVFITFTIETTCIIVDIYFINNPNGIITIEDDTMITQLYSSYRTILLVLLCFGFSLVGYLIHRKAQRLSSRNVNRASSLTSHMRASTFFLFITSILFGVMVLENLFFIFRPDRRQDSLSKSTSHVSLSCIQRSSSCKKENSSNDLSNLTISQQQAPTLTSSQAHMLRSFSSLSSVATAISDNSLGSYLDSSTNQLIHPTTTTTKTVSEQIQDSNHQPQANNNNNNNNNHNHNHTNAILIQSVNSPLSDSQISQFQHEVDIDDSSNISSPPDTTNTLNEQHHHP